MSVKLKDWPDERIIALIDLLLNKPCLTRKDLALRFGCSLPTIDRHKVDGMLPKPKMFVSRARPLWTPQQIMEMEANAPEWLRRTIKRESARQPKLPLNAVLQANLF